MTDVGLLDEVPLERGHPVLRLDDLVARLLEDPPRAPARQARVVDEQHLRSYSLHYGAGHRVERNELLSLSPASTTDRGMP